MNACVLIKCTNFLFYYTTIRRKHQSVVRSPQSSSAKADYPKPMVCRTLFREAHSNLCQLSPRSTHLAWGKEGGQEPNEEKWNNYNIMMIVCDASFYKQIDPQYTLITEMPGRQQRHGDPTPELNWEKKTDIKSMRNCKYGSQRGSKPTEVRELTLSKIVKSDVTPTMRWNIFYPIGSSYWSVGLYLRKRIGNCNSSAWSCLKKESIKRLILNQKPAAAAWSPTVESTRRVMLTLLHQNAKMELVRLQPTEARIISNFMESHRWWTGQMDGAHWACPDHSCTHPTPENTVYQLQSGPTNRPSPPERRRFLPYWKS